MLFVHNINILKVESLPLKARVAGIQNVGATEIGDFSAKIEDPDESSEDIIYSWLMTDVRSIFVLRETYF